MKRINLKLLAVIVALFALFTLRQTLMTPPAVDPNHAFDTDAAYARLVNILGDEAPHPVDSDANDIVRDRIVAEIKALGFTPIVRDDFHCREGSRRTSCARVQNIMFWVGPPPAKDAPPNAVMIASHYDSVPTGPGAADDGSGVVTSLEIARVLRSNVLKSKSLPKPVLVMITDGEEMGLIGASSFVNTDPLAQHIGAVISMEARGVRGPVALIETSTPNSRDIDILGNDTKEPVASSLAADIYAAMPNATDVTEYLELDIDVGNLAIGSGAAFYHTPRDNLAMLDKRSLFHMGTTALAGVETFLEADKTKSETQKIYMDIWGRFIIALPQGMALVALILGGIITVTAFARANKAHRWKALAFPPLALLIGVGLAFGLSWGINALRPEAHFAAAHPWALRGMQNIAALLGAMIVYKLLARAEAKAALMASGWIWICVLLGAAFILPGATILFVPALMIASLGLIAQILGRSRIAAVIVFIAAALFTSVGIQTSALGEIMLFAEAAAPFTAFVVLAFVLLAPLTLSAATQNSGVSRPLIMSAALITIGLAITAMIVPAYSVDAPRGLSVEHVQTDSGTFEYRVRGTDPVPAAMKAVVPFEVGERQQTAPVPPIDMPVTITQTLVDGQIELRLKAPLADQIEIEISPRDSAASIRTMNNLPLIIPSARQFRCTGRACRTLSVTVDGHDGNTTLNIYAYQYGLGPQSQALLDARPDWALPQHRGDRRRVGQTITLGASPAPASEP
ncbi:M28 family peptidase [Fretibacter rubidus]|uniref:M28 family peptidase n=1 Tax=Fretibacter rubidus TaxID=570162 RepID=UPI00352A8B9A